MLFYPVLVFIFLASAVLADRSSKQGQSRLFKKSEAPRPVAGARFTAPSGSVNSVTAQFYVPKITDSDGAVAASSTTLGVMIDGDNGSAGVFSGVVLMVVGGKPYYTATTNYDIYSGSDVRPGDYVVVSIEASKNRRRAYASYTSNRGSWTAIIDLNAPLSSSHGSWVVEKVPGLPLTELGTVDLTVLANIGGKALNAHGAEASSFSGDGATASISGEGNVRLTIA